MIEDAVVDSPELIDTLLRIEAEQRAALPADESEAA